MFQGSGQNINLVVVGSIIATVVFAQEWLFLTSTLSRNLVPARKRIGCKGQTQNKKCRWVSQRTKRYTNGADWQKALTPIKTVNTKKIKKGRREER